MAWVHLWVGPYLWPHFLVVGTHQRLRPTNCIPSLTIECCSFLVRYLVYYGADYCHGGSYSGSGRRISHLFLRHFGLLLLLCYQVDYYDLQFDLSTFLLCLFVLFYFWLLCYELSLY